MESEGRVHRQHRVNVSPLASSWASRSSHCFHEAMREVEFPHIVLRSIIATLIKNTIEVTFLYLTLKFFRMMKINQMVLVLTSGHQDGIILNVKCFLHCKWQHLLKALSIRKMLENRVEKMLSWRRNLKQIFGLHSAVSPVSSPAPTYSVITCPLYSPHLHCCHLGTYRWGL